MNTDNKKKNKKENLTFEESLQRLEEIVAAMEEGNLSLEKTQEYYEEGMKLAKFCAGKLGDAEKRIEALSGKDEEGNPQWQPLQDEE